MSKSIDQVLASSQVQKRKYLKLVLPLVLLGVGGIAVLYSYFGNTNSKTAKYTPQIYEVNKGDVRSVASSDGNIINPDIVNLSFLINGTLVQLYVKEGDSVEADQVLAELDKTDLEFDVRSAESDVNIS